MTPLRPYRRALAVAICAACGGDPVAALDGGADADVVIDAVIDTPLDAAAPDAAIDAPIDAAVDAPAGMLPLTGMIAPTHDPAIIATASGYYLFATGRGLPIARSTDLLEWSSVGVVFPTKPPWITTTSSSDPNLLWAPDISYFGGKYHLYYAASSFGSRSSCIGHATTLSLETPLWQDLGAVICSSSSVEWNAIDPAVIVDEEGQAWMSFGSFWGGLKLIPLDADGGRAGTVMHALATRANSAVEAPFIIHRAGWYYLFESVDHCCQGVSSTYKQMVGRADQITGPYVDRAGDALLTGGGTLLLQGDDRWKGPGHNAVLQTAGADYNVYHAYDATAGGTPTLRIGVLTWSADGWPSSPGP